MPAHRHGTPWLKHVTLIDRHNLNTQQGHHEDVVERTLLCLNSSKRKTNTNV